MRNVPVSCDLTNGPAIICVATDLGADHALVTEVDEIAGKTVGEINRRGSQLAVTVLP